MNLIWINHASFILELGSCRLICDPWLEGTAFNNSWNLLSPTKFTYEDFRDITHIWFSHEHPDHFNPPNLGKIPPQYRQRITVLFHETKDRRLINVCKAMGFITQEMPPEKRMLAGDAALLCGRHGQLDSWLAIQYDGKTLLNMNDCFYRSRSALRDVVHHVFRPDVLLTQFSYANWVGNPDDVESHRAGAREKLDEITRQVQVLQPQMIVPCASFVWFSHEENYFMNRSVNRIERIYDYCSDVLQVPAVVLYPGDSWKVGEQHDSAAALGKYAGDFEEVLAGRRGLIRSEMCSLADLQRAANTFMRKAFARNSAVILRQLPSARAYLRDLRVLLRLSFRHGLQVITGGPEEADVILSSDCLQYCLSFDWGGDTLEVSGRYEVPKNGAPQRFLRIFRVASLNSSGDRVDALLLARKALARVARAA